MGIKRVLHWWEEDDVGGPSLWHEKLLFDNKTGNFDYSAVHMLDGRKILVLAGNAKDIKQPERDRARRMACRLADTLNVAGA